MAHKNTKIELNAQKREILGSRVSQLRKSGYIPAILYGKGQGSLPLQIPVKDFKKAFELAGESTLIFINVGDQSYPTIIHDIARDAVSDDILHADFYKVRLDEKIKAKVAVVFEGESLAVRDLGGIFVRNMNELEVEAFPQDLPHEIEVDISVLKNFHDSISISDLKLGDKVEIKANPADAIVLIQEPRTEEELKAELETPTATAEDVEVIKKEKPEGEEGEEEAVVEKATTEKEKK